MLSRSHRIQRGSVITARQDIRRRQARDSNSEVQVFYRFRVMDPESGLPYTITISQEGISRRKSEAPEEEHYDCTYRVRVDENLRSQLVAEPTNAAPPSQPTSVAQQTQQAALSGHHDLRQLLQN